MLLYFSTFVLCVQIIVSYIEILDCIYFLFIKHCDNVFWISLHVASIFRMMLKNYKYSWFVAGWMEMDKKCCFVVFQHMVILMC